MSICVCEILNTNKTFFFKKGTLSGRRGREREEGFLFGCKCRACVYRDRGCSSRRESNWCRRKSFPRLLRRREESNWETTSLINYSYVHNHRPGPPTRRGRQSRSRRPFYLRIPTSGKGCGSYSWMEQPGEYLDLFGIDSLNASAGELFETKMRLFFFQSLLLESRGFAISAKPQQSPCATSQNHFLSSQTDG